MVGARDKNGMTFFNAAIRWGTPELVNACIEAGEDVNCADGELAHEAFLPASSLMAAMQSLNFETLRALLAAGADPNRLVMHGTAWELRRKSCPESIEDIPKAERKRFVGLRKRLGGGAEILRIFHEFGFLAPGLKQFDDTLSFYDIKFRPGPPKELRDEDFWEETYFERTLKTNWFPFPFPCQGTRPDALWHAATPGALREMLNAGANVNARDNAGWTALHHIASYGGSGYYLMPETMTQILIDAGTDINAVNEYGVTPMMLAAEAGWHDTRCLEIIKVLMRNGADAEIKELGGGYTALDWLTTEWNDMPDFARPLLSEIFQEMIRSVSGSGLAEVDLDLMTAAFCSEDLESVLDRGAHINAQTQNGYTPLLFASVYNKAIPVKYLLEHGADIGAKGSQGNSALSLASQTGDRSVISVLRGFGCVD